jgi:hypothetical protein
MKCVKCKKPIKESEHRVVISTLNRETKPDDHQHFHFQCWVDFFRDSVNNRSRADVEKMRLMAFSLLENPMIRGMVEKIGAGDQLNSMLGTSLIKPQVVQIIKKEDVLKKIDDDRKKAGKTKRKSQ